jgi:hypothetical protein
VAKKSPVTTKKPDVAGPSVGSPPLQSQAGTGKVLVSLDGVTRISEAEATREALNVYYMLKTLNARVTGLGGADGQPVDLSIPLKGLRANMGSISSNETENGQVLYIFSCYVNEEIKIRTRVYKKSDRLNLLADDINFACG